MWISAIEPEKLTPKQIERVLGLEWEEDMETTGDCIFVFCNGFLDRVDKALAIYKSGRAPYILFSGGTKFGEREFVEAIRAKERAIELGVPESAILIETESNHTKENVIASLLVLDRAIGLHNIKKLIVVSQAGHLRRCLLTLKTYMPQWIDYVICPAKFDLPNGIMWWENSKLKGMALNQIHNLVKYVREGQLIDEEIML
jgi:uncharacterized SAM-binding protein YcdF (DUF218 family)